MILNLTSQCVMGRIVIVEAEHDININDNDIINDDDMNTTNKYDINEKVDFYDIYDKMLKMSKNYEIQNTINRPIANIKMIKREAIWFDRQLLR